MYWEIINMGLGLLTIWLAANFVVDSAVKIAKSMNLSDAFIGLTILSVGTSLPEIFTHIFSSIDILKGIETSGISVGTNIGSNIIQISMIMGIIGLFATIKARKDMLLFEYPIMLGSILVLFVLGLDGRIGRVEGAVLALAYVIFILYLIRNERLTQETSYRANYWKEISILLFGFISLGIAANSVVDNAVVLSGLWGVSGSFIGVLVIGVSTALPEMTTAIIGIIKGAPGISLGTLVGSNITNPLFALGIGAAISGYTIEKAILWYDLPMWFFISLVPLLFFWKKLYMRKAEAVAMMLLYVVYTFIRIKVFM